MGGPGLNLDTPVFYDLKIGNKDERKFYAGLGILTCSGYEVYRKGRFELNLQSRVQFGYANVPEGQKKGVSVSFLAGVNF